MDVNTNIDFNQLELAKMQNSKDDRKMSKQIKKKSILEAIKKMDDEFQK